MLQGSDREGNQNTVTADDVDGLKGLIAKARWAGMDRDAERLCQMLGSRAPEDCVAPGPLETD